MRSSTRIALCALAPWLVLASCGDGGSADPSTDAAVDTADDAATTDAQAPEASAPAVGLASGAVCDPALADQAFARAFFDRYCTRCHSESVRGAARNGAPPERNFDDFAAIRSAAVLIDGVAAAGPRAANTTMPPSGSVPSLAERKQLGAWLACEAP